MHVKYAKYVLRHKFFVFLAGLKLGVGLWQLMTHDWSKFFPSEWVPYARFFYASSPVTPLGKYLFNVSWLMHLHRQPHHWQHWVLNLDDGGTKVLKMPERYAREMVADWRGAGQAQGKMAHEIWTWYLARRDTMLLHPETRLLVESLLNQISPSLEYENGLALARSAHERAAL